MRNSRQDTKDRRDRRLAEQYYSECFVHVLERTYVVIPLISAYLHNYYHVPPRGPHDMKSESGFRLDFLGSDFCSA